MFRSSSSKGKSSYNNHSKKLSDDVLEGLCDVLDILSSSHGPLLEPLSVLDGDKVTELADGIASGTTPVSLVEEIDNDSLIWSGNLFIYYYHGEINKINL